MTDDALDITNEKIASLEKEIISMKEHYEKKIADQAALRERNSLKKIITFLFFFMALILSVGMIIDNGVLDTGEIASIGFSVGIIIIFGFAAIILYQIIEGKISLSGLLGEPESVQDGTGKAKASLSRFQFLLFTFVVAGLFLMLSIESGGMVDIPTNVLLLLGISGGSYVVSKAVGKDQNKQ